MRRLARYSSCALLVTLASAGSAAAQGGGVLIGAKIGANAADVSFDPQSDSSTRTGFLGGAWLSFGIGKIFAFQPEVLFTQKGTKASGDFDGVTGTVTLKVNYLEVPMLAKVSVPTASSVRPVFFAGPAVAFETSCSLTAAASGVSVGIDCDAGAGFDVFQRKKTDVGLVGGAGLDIDLGTIVLAFEGRYTYGLVNLDDSGVPDASAKHRVFSALGGIAFKLPT